jgi:formylglycine-generating enzyme required for sulfatase activity
MNKKIIITIAWAISVSASFPQKLIPFKLPDTGQSQSYTATKGEDADFIINPLSFTDNGDGTITDNNTGLMWQKTDGGEMTIENAVAYCSNLSLAGYHDWRLPANHELFSINKYDKINPALNTTYFTVTLAEYWWTSDYRIDDTSRVWVVNAGGGTGAHPKSETISAGGTKHIHVRAVRNPYSTTFSTPHFTDNGNNTITDNYTGLVWQKLQSPNSLTWEQALAYASALTLAGKSDWRLPNVKELQSLNDEKLFKPSFNKTYFTNIASGNYWSSTTLLQSSTKAWDINVDYGILSYNDKTITENVLCVRGGFDKKDLNLTDVLIPAGEFAMGDHYGFVDPNHPSDELPIHNVKVDSFYIAATVSTNQQFLTFLNYSLLQGLIEVRSNIVYAAGTNNIYCYTNQYARYYSISYDGTIFSLADFRANHPVVGVMWYGAVAFCNWLSTLNGLDQCYNLQTYKCDFTKNGYRLPTEAEWEYAGRGGQNNPYLNYPWGNDPDVTKANWPGSKDPYEGTDSASYPCTTPVGFYNGSLHLKSEYNWSGSATSYQTANGVNGYGLADMAGNVWQLVNDWYAQNYNSISPYLNPTGPDTGFVMPDGKTYRGMRGGNWYNGYMVGTVNDGHSRVSNRNPSYYRGPQDPNHPWYHVSFRVARKYSNSSTGISKSIDNIPSGFTLYQNYPNPFNPSTIIKFAIPYETHVTLKVFNSLGQEIKTLADETMKEGNHEINFSANQTASGILFYKLQAGNYVSVKKMILIK